MRQVLARSSSLPLVIAVAAVFTQPSVAQNRYSNPKMTPTNNLPNPYPAKELMPLPDGRKWGSTAGVDAAKGHADIWAIDRCGCNGCVDSKVDPLMHYDAKGNLIGHMGGGLFAFDA